MKLLTVGVFFVLLASSSSEACFLQAQKQGSKTLEFEAASLRPANKDAYPHARGGPGTDDPGLYHYEGGTLQDLIAAAWSLDSAQVAGPAQIRKTPSILLSVCRKEQHENSSNKCFNACSSSASHYRHMWSNGRCP